MASPSTPPPDPPIHPLTRNALRLALSAKEYRQLHDLAARRAPALQSKLPSPSRFEAIVRSKNRHNEAAVRTSLRVFVASGAMLKLVEVVLARIRGDLSKQNPRTPLHRTPNFRLSLSLSLVLLFHRLLHRFFVRLRANLRTDEAQPFRARNPRVSRALTSRYAPAVGASVAGFALGLAPQEQLRLTAAIYAGTRSLEFLFNVMDEKGWVAGRPAWFGSWLLMPVSCAQLVHAFVFDRETTPGWLGKVLFSLSPSYIHERPELLPAEFAWPEKEEIVESLANIADLRWPPFVSPMLHPGSPNTLPAPVQPISPITGPAHPSIASLSCALLHPGSPSCGTAFVHQILLSVPRLARFLTTVTVALSVLKFKTMMAHPISSVHGLSQRIIKLTAVLSTAVGTTWGSICLLNALLPRSTLPTKRFFVSGALAGLPFAFLGNSRNVFLYFFRAAVDSAYKTGVKRGLWTSGKGGDVTVLVVAWAVIGCVLEARPLAVQGAGVRKALGWMRGDGYVDAVEWRKKSRREKTQE